jgi:hypothetical protein
MKNFAWFMDKYYEMQEQILVCYHPTEDSTWQDRCLFLSKEYNEYKPYNHRSILKNEIVIEFDNKDKKVNEQSARTVYKRLMADGFSPSLFTSGNKSCHVHVFVDVGNANNVPQLKRTFMRYYSQDLGEPDLRLAADNHLIRCEFGIHEKTGENKLPLTVHANFPKVKKIPIAIWEKYIDDMRVNTQRRMTMDLSTLENLPGFQFILQTDEFRKSDDARERALFMLIHVLKPKYQDKKEEFIQYLQDWYRYSSGTKLSPGDIRGKVAYHWNKSYSIGVTYLNELLVSIGRSDLIQEKK